VYKSNWACGNNHMLSHPMRYMLKIYAIRGLFWSYIKLYQGSFKVLKVDTSYSILRASRIFFTDSSKVDINENQFFNNLPLWN
jgi:hypothetical protein